MLHSILQSTPNIDPIVKHLRKELDIVLTREKEVIKTRDELEARILISD
jgi:hypothetical protein